MVEDDKEKDSFQTFISPIRFDRDEATRVEAEEMMLVVKNREPSDPSARENFRWKKATIQDLVSCSELSDFTRAEALTQEQGPKPSSPQQKEYITSPLSLYSPC
jgi:hypothetical protein